jgi:Relaxase/Mobilisation nuclease domain
VPKTLSDGGSARPLLDIASYARRGPGHRDRLSPEEIQLIARTVKRTPEVMVKVLSRGGQDAKSVGRHFAYLSRKGDLEIETDDGQRIVGKGAEAELLDDWDLDIQEQRPTSSLGPGLSRRAPKLVHKVLFSMPPGTPPRKVVEAVKVFAREEFGLKHRYAMVLHTDEPHPHVHMVVKAVSEEGVRLNVRKATLREWRSEFARHLRALGVAANATQRYVRGETGHRKMDGIHRASLRGESTYLREHTESVKAELLIGTALDAPGKSVLLHARRELESGWHSVASLLAKTGYHGLASDVKRFVERMPPARTEHELIAQELQKRVGAPDPLDVHLRR